MMSLLFLLFLGAIVLALMDKEKPSLITYVVAMAASLFWLHHHIGATLSIQL
jgi:alpha-D-ribose 1-methylphosphonate 5-triphosphate synthase subunit PhnH